MISFLHTSAIHIDRFENLVRIYDTEIPVKHYVNSNLLEYALKNGSLNTQGFQQEIATIQEEQPELIICTCSSYGAACDEINSIARIDHPIAHHLVSNYQTIALAYTVHSTQKVSKDLLENIAEKQQKTIDIIDCDCSHAWKYFKAGQLEKYEKAIAKKLKEVAPNVDAIFLAQASMEGAVKFIPKLKDQVFSSPEFGVKTYLKKLMEVSI